MILTKNILIVLLFITGTALHSFSQEWKVPDRKKNKTAPTKFTPENISKGETVFNTNCVACHGNPGKMNFTKMNPSPGDPGGEKFQKNTDGELFFKITNGKLPMPAFKNTISEEDRWNVIAFLRSFNSNYIQPEPKKDEGTDYTVSLQISQIQQSNKILVKATATTKTSTVPEFVKNADVTLYAQRKFGILQIGKKGATNDNGEITFLFPADLPGDTAGIVSIIAKLSDEIGDYGEAETFIKLPIGKPTHVKSLLDTRAMWTVRSQAPVWLILSYCCSVIIVFGIIIYILLQLKKLRELDSDSLKKNNHE